MRNSETITREESLLVKLSVFVFVCGTVPVGISDRGVIAIREMTALIIGALIFGLCFTNVITTIRRHPWCIAPCIFILTIGITSLLVADNFFLTFYFYLVFYLFPLLFALSLYSIMNTELRDWIFNLLFVFCFLNAILIIAEAFFPDLPWASLRPIRGEWAERMGPAGLFNGRTEGGAYMSICAVLLTGRYLVTSSRFQWLVLPIFFAIPLFGSRNALIVFLLGLHLTLFAILWGKTGIPYARVPYDRRLLFIRYLLVLLVTIVSVASADAQRSRFITLFTKFHTTVLVRMETSNRIESSNGASTRLPEQVDESIYERLVLYSKSWHAFKAEPLLGKGIRNLGQAHNLFLNFLGETGLIGTGFLLWILITLYLWLYRNKLLLAYATIPMTCFLVALQFDYFLGHTSCLSALFAVIVALFGFGITEKSEMQTAEIDRKLL